MGDIEWRDVVGYEGIYKISSNGQIYSAYKNRLRVCHITEKGYSTIILSKDGKGRTCFIHRLVADAFIGPCPGKFINHKNGNKQDNHYSNLEWVTNEENIAHSFAVLKQKITPLIVIKVDDCTMMEFPSICAAVREGFNDVFIRMVLTGKKSSHNGYVFLSKDRMYERKEHP